MKKTQRLILPLFLSLFISLFGIASPVQASDEAGDGQVTRGGKIMFYEETQLSSSTEPSTSEILIPTSSSAPDTAKPVGRFPKTGELVRQYGWIGGGLLLLLFCLLFLRNSKKEERK
ncbi:LPXTG cell wall anchor domain-containing protein [Enterococcus crotali]|uniref:LPXTG cell wall anchor domain-containing protein n=1 Tax=Enterococcus crotali TaxID=1453587 RepID=UPI0004702381|nr:LPXTG cell wall anchor domain-containing protein [Enterococcus crotali]